MLQQKHIQVPILIVIEKNGLGIISNDIQTPFCSAFRKGIVAIIYKKLIAGMLEIQMRLPDMIPWIEIADRAYVDIQKTISVYVCHGNSGGPICMTGHSCSLCNILEGEMPFVKVQFIASRIGSEIDVGQTVIIDITDDYTGPVIEIQVIQDAERVGVNIIINEGYTCLGSFQRGE